MSITITDLTPRYLELIVKHDRPDEYRNLYPTLFRHLSAHWGDSQNSFVIMPPDEVRNRVISIRRRLLALQERFTGVGLDLEDMPILLMVGKGVTVGHAYLDNGKPVVWLPIETYTTDMSIDIFGTHELLHALHYQHSPEFYFHDMESQHRVSRRLITEGLVTFLTQKVLGVDDLTALWADYLGHRDAAEWIASCRHNDTKLRRLMTVHFDRSEPHWGPFAWHPNIWSSPPVAHGASSTPPSSTPADASVLPDPKDVFNFRGGYYTGLKVVQEIAAIRAGDPFGLLHVSRNDFEKLVRRRLDTLRNGHKKGK